MKRAFFQLALAAVFLGSFYESHSQARESAGYIVTNENDTIYGRIKYDLLRERIQPCLFGVDENFRVYEADEIKGFGILTVSRVFTSHVTDTSFVEVLLDGAMGLFKDDDRHYVTKRGEETQEFDLKELKGQGNRQHNEFGLRKDNSWKGVVAYLMSDCETSSGGLEDETITENLLLKLIEDYNICKGYDFEKFERVFKAQGSVGVSFGILSSGIKIPDETKRAKVGNQLFNYTLREETVLRSSSIFFGFGVSVRMRKFALEQQVLFSKYSFTSSLSGTPRPNGISIVATENRDININILSLPLVAKIRLVEKSTSLSMLVGGAPTIIDAKKAESERAVTIYSNGNGIFGDVSTVVVNKSSFFSPVLGFEVARDFDSKTVAFNVKLIPRSKIGMTSDSNSERIVLGGYFAGLTFYFR